MKTKGIYNQEPQRAIGNIEVLFLKNLGTHSLALGPNAKAAVWKTLRL